MANSKTGGGPVNWMDGGIAPTELARVRAKFGIDPALPSSLFADAWESPVGALEEDEAEFVDAVSDYLCVGLPLDAAVASWASGALAADDDPTDDDAETEIGPLAELHYAGIRRTIVR